MYKEPMYMIEEGTSKKEKRKLILFIILIVIITIGIIGITGIITFRMINGDTSNPIETMLGERTTGKSHSENDNGLNVLEIPNNKVTEEQEVIPEPIQSPETVQNQSVLKFPLHDFIGAMASQSPQYSEEIAQKVVDVYFEEAKKIYLTFDDGPTERTPEVLDILKKYGVKATFFVLGANVDNNPELTKRIYDEGHFIANHGYSHQYSYIYEKPQNVLDEYNKTLEAIRNAIGDKVYNPHLFRFPGGSAGGYYADVKQEAIGLLRDNEIAYTNWNCLTGDAEGCDTIDEMWDYINETSAGDDNLVILMHDAADKQMTVEFLPQLIEKYISEGYEFCTYYDVMK